MRASDPYLGECLYCGADVVLDIDHESVREVCFGCGRERAPAPVLVDRATIRREIRMSRRLLLCPACKLREHFRCQSTTCECPYKPHIRRPAGPVEPEAMRLLAAETPGDLEPWEVE